MKKRILACTCCLAAALVFGGCKSQESTRETVQTQESAETSEQTQESAKESEQTQEESSEAAEVPEKVEINGEVKLGTYKGLKVSKMDLEVSDEELQASIDSRLDANPASVEVDRAAQIGDTVNIDYSGKLDGVAFDGGTAQGQDLVLGSGMFIDGFEEGLVGAVKGQELDLDLTFPENYGNEELAGKAVVFEVKVNAVLEEQKAELNSDFVSRMTDGAVTDVEQWKNQVKEELEGYKKQDAEMKRQSELLEALVSGAQFSGYEQSAKDLTAFQISQAEQMGAMYGMTLADMASVYQMEESEYRDYIREQSENQVKTQLALRQVASEEKLELTEEDRQQIAEENGAASVEELLAQLGEDGETSFEEYGMEWKALHFLEENAIEE